VRLQSGSTKMVNSCIVLAIFYVNLYYIVSFKDKKKKNFFYFKHYLYVYFIKLF
jgi:hypothetical protein